MPTLDLHLLGIPQLLIDDQPVQLVRRASLALLAYLAVTKRMHPRDEIAAFLSGDDSDEAARKRLRNVLTDLTEHGLGPFLSSDRRFIGMRQPMDHALDIDRLDALLATGSPSDADQILWAAERCDLEFMAGVVVNGAPEFEAWLLNEREHRRRQMTKLTTRYLEQHVWTGSYQEGIAIARRLVAVEPWNEAGHRTLMRLLSADGQHAAALAQFERCRTILADDLGVEPQEETILIARRLRATHEPIRHNLPEMSNQDALLGRDAARDLLARNILDPRCRLLTVIGLEGVGKTSLTVAAASRIAITPDVTTQHPFADGIAYVDLRVDSPATAPPDSDADVDQHLDAIGHALGIAFYGRVDPLKQITAFLQDKNMLLVIDSADCIPCSSTILGDMLDRSPLITILAISRAPLGVSSEWTMELSGLQLPKTASEVPTAAASQLVLRDAQKIGVEIHEADWPDVAAICRATGGLPLALRVAANALSTLSCAEVASELTEGSMLLEDATTVAGDSVSVRDTMQRAITFLPPTEQHVLPRLAVFSAPFSREAAAGVGVPFSALTEACRHLLVERNGEQNYSLHPLVRRVAKDQLSEDLVLRQEVHTLHAAHYAAIVDEVSPTIHNGRMVSIATDRAIWANVQTAWTWAIETRDLSLMQRLFAGLDSWYLRSGEHASWGNSIEQAIAVVLDSANMPEWTQFAVRLHAAAAETLLWQGDIDAAFTHIASARGLAKQVDPIRMEALLSLVEGRLLRFQEDDGLAARELLHQARSFAHITDQTAIEAASLMALSHAAYDVEEFSQAEHYAQRAAGAYRTLGDRYALARTTMQQARLLVARGSFRTAETAINESIRIAQTFGDRFVEASSHALLGTIYDVGYGRHRDAAEHYLTAERIGRDTGDPYLEGIILRGRGRNAMHMGHFDDASTCFRTALTLAKAHGIQRAVDDALTRMAYVSIAIGDVSAAAEHARQVIASTQHSHRQFARATGLLIHGLALEQLGVPFEATAAYSQAIAIAETLQNPHLLCDALSGMAGIMSSNNSHEIAHQAIQPVVDYLFRHQLSGCEEPSRVALTAYRILHGCNDSRADEVLRAGSRIVQTRAALLPEQEASRYINAYPDRIALTSMNPPTASLT